MATAPAPSSSDLLAELEKVCSLGVDGQAKRFLTEFVGEFAGNFEEVLELAEEFKAAVVTGEEEEAKAGPSVDSAGRRLSTVAAANELSEYTMHLFLERRDETTTVTELRDALKKIDLDANGSISFIEYLLYKYNHTLEELFAEKENSSAALLRALEDAIAEFQAVLAERQADAEKQAELAAAAEGTGVKAMKAKAELAAMRARSNTGQNVKEVRAQFRKKKAQRDLDTADPVKEELKRVEAEKQKAADEAAAAAEASRERLKARAAFLESGGGAKAPSGGGRK